MDYVQQQYLYYFDEYLYTPSLFNPPYQNIIFVVIITLCDEGIILVVALMMLTMKLIFRLVNRLSLVILLFRVSNLETLLSISSGNHLIFYLEIVKIDIISNKLYFTSNLLLQHNLLLSSITPYIPHYSSSKTTNISL